MRKTITFDIYTESDAIEAGIFCRALRDAFRSCKDDPELEAATPRIPPVPAPAPASAPQKKHGGRRAGAGRPPAGISKTPAVKPLDIELSSIDSGSSAAQLDLVDRIDELKRAEATERPESERERLKAIAIDRGVVWVREILATRGAARLSELTDEQVRTVLNDAA